MNCRAARLIWLCVLFCDSALTQFLKVQPADLRAHVEFLACDELEGRSTPSKGLEIASVYIAAQFRRAGLAALPDGTYFQAGDKPGVKNVIGVLKGSDPKLADQYVIVSAHYDHIGVKKSGEGDLINNGANDDASGVASMMAAASLLARTRPLPRRSIVFIAFAGEELGMVGSRYYAANPIFPIASTVAQINLEQTGRPDDLEQSNNATFNLTGYRYSQVASILTAAALPYGIKVAERPEWSDKAFELSDNEALAKAGVPAHTISVAYMFPDYHKVSDQWDKLDYENMARVTAAATAGIRALANRLQPPHWFSDAPDGTGSNATELSKPITRPAAPPAASAPGSGRSPANRQQQPQAPSPAR